MPGKHAPSSPVSFYFSLARAAGGVVGAIVLVVVLTVVAFGGRSDRTPKAPVATGTAPARTPSPSPVPTPSVVPSPTPGIRTPSQTTLAVLNGSGRTGLARRTANQAEAAGYEVKKVDNAQSTKISTIYYQPAFEAEARALQKRFPGFTQVKPATSSVPSDVMLTMVIGADYP
jgi:hypothetical protein